MALGDRTDPFLNYRFGVEIEGLIVGGFSEASGLQVEVETEDYQEGGVNDYTHKLPKTLKHPNLVLKRRITDTDALWKWRSAVGKPKAKIERKTGPDHTIGYRRQRRNLLALLAGVSSEMEWARTEG